MGSQCAISSMCYEAKGKLFVREIQFKDLFNLEQELRRIELDVSWDAFLYFEKNQLW